MRRLFFCAFTIALLTTYSLAQAERVLEYYDIDSLMDMSAAVVRAEVGDSKPVKTEDGDFVQYTVTIRDVFKGPIKAGASINVAGLDEFQRAPGMAGHADAWNPISRGDMVYLFLAPNDNRIGYAKYRFADANWLVIESGARLLDGQTVYAFLQYFPRLGHPTTMPARTVWRGFVAMTPLTDPGSKTLTRQEFEDRLKASEKTIARFDQLKAAPASPRTGEQIVAFLHARVGVLASERASDDELGSKLAQRLDKTSTPATVLGLLDESPESTRAQLEYLLESRFGRDYLLATAADKNQPVHVREQCVRLLADSGGT